MAALAATYIENLIPRLKPEVFDDSVNFLDSAARERVSQIRRLQVIGYLFEPMVIRHATFPSQIQAALLGFRLSPTWARSNVHFERNP